MEANNKISLGNQGENIKKRFHCDVCAADFSGPSGLFHHKQSIHKGVSFQCSECDNRFSMKYDLKIHYLARHENVRHACHQCGYEGLYKKDLAQHTKTKHEHRRFYVNKCTKSFSRAQKLNLHMGTHTGTIYSCEHCDLTFTLMQNLQRHKKIKHIVARIYKKDDTPKDGHEFSNVAKIKTVDCMEELFTPLGEKENDQKISSKSFPSNSNPLIMSQVTSKDLEGSIEGTKRSVKVPNQNNLDGPKGFLSRPTSSYWKWRCVDQRPKKSKLSGWQLSTRKNFPDEVLKSFSRQKKCA